MSNIDTKVTLDIVYGNDEWDAAYIDGELVDENFGLPWVDVMTSLAGRAHTIRYGQVITTWTTPTGSAASKLSDIPADAWIKPLSPKPL